MGARAPPRAVKKIFRRNLHGKCVSASPGHEVHSPFRALKHFLLGGLDLEVRVLKTTTKKVVNFLDEKVHPRQNPGYAYGLNGTLNKAFCITQHSGLLLGSQDTVSCSVIPGYFYQKAILVVTRVARVK